MLGTSGVWILRNIYIQRSSREVVGFLLGKFGEKSWEVLHLVATVGVNGVNE